MEAGVAIGSDRYRSDQKTVNPNPTYLLTGQKFRSKSDLLIKQVTKSDPLNPFIKQVKLD